VYVCACAFVFGVGNGGRDGERVGGVESGENSAEGKQAQGEVFERDVGDMGCWKCRKGGGVHELVQVSECGSGEGGYGLMGRQEEGQCLSISFCHTVGCRKSAVP
jgi:hypothetical protein